MRNYNCPKIRQMIRKHPYLMGKILHKLQKHQPFKYWHKLCMEKELEAMGILIHCLLLIKRGVE